MASKPAVVAALPKSTYRTGFCGGSVMNKTFVSFGRDSHSRCTMPSTCACTCHEDPPGTPWYDHLTKEQRDAAIAASSTKAPPPKRRVARRPRTAPEAATPPPRRVARRPRPRA